MHCGPVGEDKGLLYFPAFQAGYLAERFGVGFELGAVLPGGFFESCVLVDAVGFEVDDFGVGDPAFVILVEVNAVEDTRDELVALHIAEGFFAPERDRAIGAGKAPADGGVGQAVSQERMGLTFGRVQPGDLFECVVHLCAVFGCVGFEVE